MELLRQMGEPGVLSEENREKFVACGIRLPEIPAEPEEKQRTTTERDIVMNYHIRQILNIRSELLAALGKDGK